jgi:hypothetical protein
MVTAPYYVKTVRAGSTITGYVSSDGASWTTVGSVTRTATATFDNVR